MNAFVTLVVRMPNVQTLKEVIRYELVGYLVMMMDLLMKPICSVHLQTWTYWRSIYWL